MKTMHLLRPALVMASFLAITIPTNMDKVQAQSYETFSVNGGMALNTNNSFRLIDGQPRMAIWQHNVSDVDQQFQRLAQSDGSFLLRQRSTGKCLNAYRVWDGAEVNVWPCSTSDPDQRFRLNNLGSGVWQIQRSGTNLCIDSPTRSNGGIVHLWACDANNPNQRWQSSLTSPSPVISSGTIFRRAGSVWEVIPGTAVSVAIGGSNSTWLIGSNPVPGGFGIYQRNGSGWQGVDGGAVDVAVAPNGQPWVVNDQGYIFRRSNNVWQVMPGRARDIDIGLNGSIWAIGTNPVAGGFGIYRWNGSGWQEVGGGAVRIAVAPNGQPWVVNSGGYIFRRVNGVWQNVPGFAKDIAVGHNGSVWIIGANPVPGGYSIHRWNGSGWQAIDGGAVRVAVDNNGNPWVINNTPPAPPPPPSNTIMDATFFLNNWRSWSQYTTQNPFPNKGMNCTWYAHGRMLQLGFSEYALDSMLGNAGTWDNTAARGNQVVNTPRVGSIAVWEAYVNNAGSVGHVAVVERINSDGTITISESNWAGRAYNVRTIAANNPSKFIIVPR